VVTPQALQRSTAVKDDPFGEFQAALLEQYPASYGGFFQGPDGTFSVVVVGTDPSLEATARQLFDDLPTEFGVSTPASDLTLTFVPGPRTLATLHAIQDQINASITSAAAAAAPGTSPGVYGTGIDQATDQVVVFSDGTDAAAVTTAAYVSAYGSAVQIKNGPTPSATAGRTGDIAPWYSGDQIVSTGTPDFTYCTLGFGVHNTSNGQHFSLTAGHCGSKTWYNTSHSTPKRNTSTLVGSTYAGSLAGPGSGLDVQLVKDASSDVMWKGALGATTPTTITGYSNPFAGASVCLEGSISGERCGTVEATTVSSVISGEGYSGIVSDLFTTNVAPIPGDSGGPVLFPSVYGALAGGDIDAYSGNTGFSEEIDAVLYVESVKQGAQVTVNTSSNT
jgi:streptogrisin B